MPITTEYLRETVDSPRTRFVEHRGERILLLDFSGLALEDDVIGEIETARGVIERQEPGSLVTLTNVAGARINTPRVAAAFRDAAEHNAPFVRAAAVVGMSPQQRVVYEAVMLLTGRKLHAFEDLDAALDWLAEQDEPVD